ncbi:unnamed protein product [Sphagnum compactum]
MGEEVRGRSGTHMMAMVMRPRLSAFFLPAMATIKAFEQRARLRVFGLLFRSHVGRGWLGFRGEEDLPSAEPSLLGN